MCFLYYDSSSYIATYLTPSTTISIGGQAGLLHPLTPRGKVMYRGEEAFKESLSLLSIVSRRSGIFCSIILTYSCSFFT